MPPGIRKGLEFRYPLPGEIMNGHLADLKVIDDRGNDHFRGEFHADGIKPHLPEGVPGESAHTAVDVRKFCPEEKPGHRR